MAGPVLRRNNGIVSRRRLEDEEGEGHEHEDDSMTEGSVSDDEDVHSVRSDATHQTESPVLRKVVSNGHMGAMKRSEESAAGSSAAHTNGTTHPSELLNGIENIKLNDTPATAADVMSEEAFQPVVAKSIAAMDRMETPVERRRREHEDYKKQRDENPAFVPNRGAFFMHDHRHAGPAANGFRPFGRGRGRGGRGGIGGPFAPGNFMSLVNEPTDSPWTHDMHEAVLEDSRSQRSQSRQSQTRHTYNNAQSARLPLAQATRGPAPTRALSSTKLLGNVQIRVFLPFMEKPVLMPAIAIHQYTRLPDHRPPLRRDKPVRISISEDHPRYIFPAVERSFIFIPRAQRPNQQGFGSRSNRGRQGLGSVGGFSRRTSVYGGDGSIYGGSMYSPSVAMSRRSSLVPDIPRDIMTPMGTTMSRPQMQMDSGKPIVRFPPSMQQIYGMDAQRLAEAGGQFNNIPQQYPMPQKPTFRENRQNPTPMQHPRPQKAVSVDNIESPAALQYTAPQQYQQPFSQQLPPQITGHGYGGHPMMPHSRNTSYQGSSGTPLSQIPERAIHAQPFHPNAYQQLPQEFYPQQYQMMQQAQQGFYYPPPQYANSIASMTSLAPAFSQQIAAPIPQQMQQRAYISPPPAQAPVPVMSPEQQAGVVTQEVNGMFYYYDASQIPAVAAFPFVPQGQGQMQSYPVQQLQPQQGMGLGMVEESTEAGLYYGQQQGMGQMGQMGYYPQ